ncbi:caspase domain-containing protein [Lactarius pseudohatsudake]|nr:caspase domain-containing protein [Lactarius pseudohatsudake]
MIPPCVLVLNVSSSRSSALCRIDKYIPLTPYRQPPHQFPVSPTYPVGSDASAIPWVQEPMRHIDRTRRPPQLNPSSRRPVISAQTSHRQYDLIQEHPLYLQAATQPYSPHFGQKKKALLVGTNYFAPLDSRSRLEPGVRDAHEIAQVLHRHFGFEGNNIRVLTDEQPENLPTRENTLAAMRWLVEGAQPNDSLFFYYSRYATQCKGTNEDETHGPDECFCTMDCMSNVQSSSTTPGIITEDDMYDIMVKPLPLGCRLTAVLDCCHYLPFIYDSRGVPKPRNTNATVHRRSSNADVICLSACKDSGRAFESHERGSLGRAFIEFMTRWGNRGTYLDVIRSFRTYMDTKGLRQRPQLSSSRPIDLEQWFRLTDEHPQGFTVPSRRHQVEENPASATASDSHLLDSTRLSLVSHTRASSGPAGPATHDSPSSSLARPRQSRNPQP